MEQITVNVPDFLKYWLCQEADRRGTTVDELVVDAVNTYKSRPPRRLRAAGAGGSGQSDISVRIEELIAAEWGKKE